MKIFKSISLRNAGPTCRRCIYFQNNPALVERAYPGLTTMCSGFASVRDQDGFCEYHQLYLSAGDSCANFTTRAQELGQHFSTKHSRS